MTAVASLEIDFAANMAKLVSDVARGTDAVVAGAERMQAAAEQTKKAFETLAVGFGIERFVEFVGQAIEAAAALDKLSQRTGMTTESLSQLQYAAKLADVPIDTLTTGMKKLAVSISQGIAGDQQKIALFKQLGISTSDLGQGTEAVMLKMANAYANARDGAGKTALSIALMGKAGDEMIPLLNGGAQAIIDLKNEADRLGLTISSDFAEQSVEFEDNLKRLHAASQKLAIVLAQDVVEGTGKAMKAFADATIEGNKLAGVVAFIQTLFTGDDQHKANVTLVEDTDKMLRAQNDLDRLKRQGYADDSMAVVTQRAKIAGLQSEIDTTLNYKHSLEGQADASKAAADAAKKAREEGVQLQAASKQAIADAKAEEAEYRNIVKVVQTKIDTTNAELKSGMALTDYQKLEIQTLRAVKAAKIPLTDEHKRATDAILAQAKAQMDLLAVEQADLKNAKTYAQAWGDANQQQADFDKAQADHGAQFLTSIHDQKLALEDSNTMLQAEASLVADTNQQRATTLGQLQIQLALDREIYKIKHDEMLTAADKTLAIAQAQANAEKQKQQVADKAALQEQITLMGQIEQTGKQMWDILWQGGSDTFKKLGQALKTYLLDLLYQMTAKRWVLSFGASMTGGAAGATGSAGSALSGVNAASSLYSGATSAANWLTGSVVGSGSASSILGAGTTAFGVVDTAAVGVGATSVGAGMSAALSAVPVYGWIALGALALASAFMGKGGGPKQGGYFGAATANPNGGAVGGMDTANAQIMSTMQSTVGALNAQFDAMASAMGGATGTKFGLGVSTDPQGTSPSFLEMTARNAADQAVYSSINLKVGRSQEELTKAISDATTNALFEALKASNLSKPFADFFATVSADATPDAKMAAMQMAQEVGTLWNAIDSLGAPFASLRTLSIQGADGLVKLAGGLQNLTAQLDSFHKNFYSQDEQNAQMAKNISATLVAAGLQYTADQITAMTRDAFRGLVEYEMSLGDAGTTAVAALLSVQQAFADIHPAATATAAATQSAVTQVQTLAEALDSLANPIRTVADIAKSIFNMQQQGQSLQVQLLTAQGNAAAAAALQRSIDTAGMTDAELAVYNYNQGIKDQIQALADAKQAAQDAATATDTAYQSLQSAVTAQKSVLQQSITDIQSVFNAVKQGATTLYGQVSSTQQAQAMQGSQFIANALSAAQKTGYLPDPAQLQSAITAAMAGISAQTYATQFEADRARLVLAGQLSQLQDISGSQLSDAQKQLQALDDLLTQSKAQIDQLRGINAGVMSVSDALAGLQRAIEAEQASKAAVASSGISHTLSNGVVVSGMSSTDAFFNPYTAKWTGATGPAASAGGVQAQLASMGLALSAAGIVPAYADGTDYVPSTGLAMIHQGERIIPRELNQSSASGDSLLTRIADRLDRLQAVTERQGQHLETVSSAFKGGQQMPLLVQTV